MDLPEIEGDKNILYRVITNLVDNAIKYSNADGKIAVEASYGKKENELLFCISDEGPGIPEEYREKIFQSFFTIDRGNNEITNSTGIGLSFCKLAIEAHGGKIWVEENSHGGSRFYFTLRIK